MHVTGEITLGSIGIIISIAIAVLRVGVQIGGMQTLTKIQGDSIMEHTKRLDLYESRLISVVSDVQRMIGRLEATQDRIEKRTGHRDGEGGDHL